MSDPDLPARNSADGSTVLVEALPSVSRIALTYAPQRLRPATLALLALDNRLAGLLRRSSEPMLAQLRLSWWRETLAQDSSAWPAGDPLLSLLASWNGRHGALTALVDGWEAITGPAPLPETALNQLAQGRAAAFAVLADVAGREGEAAKAALAARRWALADLAMRIGNERERASARALADEALAGHAPRLSRALRPLSVLEMLARRRFERDEEAAAISPTALLTAFRVGLLGI